MVRISIDKFEWNCLKIFDRVSGKWSWGIWKDFSQCFGGLKCTEGVSHLRPGAIQGLPSWAQGLEKGGSEWRKSGGEGGLGTQASWGAQHGWLAAVWMVNCSIWLSNTLSLASTLQALNLRIWTSNSNTLLLHIQLVGNFADLRNIWSFHWELKWKSMKKINWAQ